MVKRRVIKPSAKPTFKLRGQSPKITPPCPRGFCEKFKLKGEGARKAPFILGVD